METTPDWMALDDAVRMNMTPTQGVQMDASEAVSTAVPDNVTAAIAGAAGDGVNTDADAATGTVPARISTGLRALPVDERPRERLRQLGVGALALRELLAVLLHSGTREADALAVADALITRFGGLAELLRASLDELQVLPGIGPARAAALKAALELGRRACLASLGERPQVKTPADAAQLLMPEMAALEQEEVRTVLLDTRNRVLGTPMIYRGSLNSASVRIGELFKLAIRANAASLILVHNHPSGSPEPSGDDVHVTREAIKAGKLVDIELLDHIIIGHNRFTSLKERGLAFE